MKIFLKVILPTVLLILLATYFWQANHDDAFDSCGLLEAPADQLKETVVVADLQEPIPVNTNVLWCGTFQLTWNEICSLLGENLHFRGQEPASVGALNQKLFQKDDLDSASYVALADYVKNGIYGKIQRELEKKFGGAASPHFLPRPANAFMPNDIVSYAYLFKNLEFANPFEKLDQPLVFRDVEIPSFGINEEYKAGQDKLREQVSILYYENRDHFAVELKTKSQGDRLILVKMDPAKTLEKTIAAFNDQVKTAKPISAEFVGLMLKVPKLNFDITRIFKELEGLPLALQKTTDAHQITSAVQNIRFQMDEKGVRLKSESHISIGCSASGREIIKYFLIFDKPFLILLQRTEAKVPYFALWVDNPEILAAEKK